MGASFTVPDYITEDLREGACGELQRASEGLREVTQTPGHLTHPEWYQEHLIRFDDTRALLNEIGWVNCIPPTEVNIDLAKHGPTLLASLRGVLADAEDATGDVLAGRLKDPLKRQAITERATVLAKAVSTLELTMDAAGIRVPPQDFPSQRARDNQPALLTVQPEMAHPLRDGLHRQLAYAAEGIARAAGLPGREKHPEWYAKDQQRLTSVERLLNVLGWGPEYPGTVEVDLRRHSWALTSALEVALIVAEDEWQEVDRTDAEGATPSKRDAVAGRLLVLREFASTVSDRVGALDTSHE